MTLSLKVLTIGTFDLFHIGHLRLLKRCTQFGEVVVGVNSDDFVLSDKGKPPVMSEKERTTMIEELGYEAVVNHSAGKALIEKVSPSLLVIGSDWAQRDYLTQIGVTQQWLDDNNIMLMYVPYTMGISSTEIKRRLLQQ